MGEKHSEAMRRYWARRKAEEHAAREAARERAERADAEPLPNQMTLDLSKEDKPIEVGPLATQQDIAEQVVQKKKRGLKPASMEANFKGDKSEISQAIINATRYIKATPCKSDEEFAERIEAYFQECAEEGIIPKWETIGLALGISRAECWNIATGRKGSPARQKMMQRAKDILAAIDSELVQTGKVNPVVWIFRAKNFYDMKDQQDVVITPKQPLGEQQTTEELADKYSTLIELDDDE